MRNAFLVSTLGSMLAVALAAPPAAAEGSDPRPAPQALRLEEEALLANFTAEVGKSERLRTRALALWNTHFAARADELRRRFESEPDWRPAYADAAALVDEFLEASELPRARAFPAGEGQVYIETLDPRTGRRTRKLESRPDRAIFAPVDVLEGMTTDDQKKKPAPAKQLRRERGTSR